MRPLTNEVTIHTMVRNENPIVFYALMSILPVVQHMIIADTGSTDGTVQLLESIKVQFPEKDIQLWKMHLPDSTKWKCNERITPNFALSECRKQMIYHTKTPYVWVLDGDEVYTDSAADRVAQTFLDWPLGIRCIYIPLIWFAIDRFHLADVCKPVTYPRACRLFETKGLTVEGLFPGELHAYKDGIIHPGDARTGVLGNVSPIFHYELVQKPYRRELVSTIPFTGKQPEVFEHEYENTNLHSYAWQSEDRVSV